MSDSVCYYLAVNNVRVRTIDWFYCVSVNWSDILEIRGTKHVRCNSLTMKKNVFRREIWCQACKVRLKKPYIYYKSMMLFICSMIMFVFWSTDIHKNSPVKSTYLSLNKIFYMSIVILCFFKNTLHYLKIHFRSFCFQYGSLLPPDGLTERAADR